MRDSITEADKFASTDTDCLELVTVHFVSDVNDSEAPEYFQACAEVDYCGCNGPPLRMVYLCKEPDQFVNSML